MTTLLLASMTCLGPTCSMQAHDVPGHLRAMQAERWKGRYSPSMQLANSLVHQGTRSEAAVYTVPFLVRMALDARIAHRDRIVGLLSFMAIGLDNNYLPDRYDPGEDRALLAELRSEGEAWTANWNADHPDMVPIKVHEGIYSYGLLEAEAVVTCYNAVRERLPELYGLLQVDDAAVRTEVAYLLAWFPEAASASIPQLTGLLDTETSPVASATAIIALGLLGDPASIPLIRGHLTCPATEVRWAAAFALNWLGVADGEVVAALIEAIIDPPAKSEIRLPYLSGETSALAMQAFVTARLAAEPAVIEAMLTGLARSIGQGRLHIKEQISRVAFLTGRGLASDRSPR